MIQKRRNFAFVVVSAVMAVSVIGIRNAAAQAHSPYQILDSGFPADDLRPTLWVDNARVLFTGIELGAPCSARQSRRCGDKGLMVGTYLWNVRSNSVTRYKDLVISNPCAQGNRISYALRDKDEDRVASTYAGPFGREKRLGLVDEYRYHNPIGCSYHRQAPPDWIRRRVDPPRPWVRPLLDEHGWLEMEKESGASVIVGETYAPRLVRSEGDPGRTLEVDHVPSKTLNYGYNVSYLPFAKTYLVWGILKSSSDLAPAWYLRPDGNVEAIVIPAGPWNAARYLGSKPGLFLISGNSRRFDEPGHAGGYLVAGGAIKKVATGDLRQPSVSPDGCRVAFIFSRSQKDQAAGYRAWSEGKPGNTIRIIDLCEGEKK